VHTPQDGCLGELAGCYRGKSTVHTPQNGKLAQNGCKIIRISWGGKPVHLPLSLHRRKLQVLIHRQPIIPVML
jgi:hypothetical protein